MCVWLAHFGDRIKKLYELTRVPYYATVICRPSENENYGPVNHCGKIQTLCIRP